MHTENQLRKRFREKGATYGLWITVESPCVTEAALALGLDWVCIDMEHGHQDFREVMDHLRILRGTDTTPLVRVPNLEMSSIKRALDMGAHGVIVPYAQSAEEVRAATRYGKYPPSGVRGVAGDRCVKWGLGFQDYLLRANEETLVIPLIETRGAVEEIDAILETPGLEVIFFGPADLSASYGYLGEWDSVGGVGERILEIRAKAEEKQIATGIMSRSIQDSVLRREQGFRMVGLGADMGLLIRAIRENLTALQREEALKLWL